MTIDEEKYAQVRDALDGLDVEWRSHYQDGRINMARVNGYSIIWHQYAYGHDDPGIVEVYGPDWDEPERVHIDSLKQLVTSRKE